MALTGQIDRSSQRFSGLGKHKILKKFCLLAHFGAVLRANQQDLKTDFVFLNDTFGSLVGKKTQHLDIDTWLYM
jgi:hypothetical protein